jgi:hypothetical protein
MTSGESVTEFAIRRNWKPGDRPGTVKDPEYAPVAELLTALNAHLKARDLEPEEYGFSSLAARYEDPDVRVPASYRWLIAFAVEGGSEGYYIHVGAMTSTPTGAAYTEFGLAKTWDVTRAYAIATEAQRFLTAADWN